MPARRMLIRSRVGVAVSPSFTTVNPPGICTNIASANDEAYLAFTPVNGHVYILW